MWNSLGNKGEKRAAAYLKSKGYKIIERNYRCKLGEIDLIAEKDNIIIFVEVKTRANDRFGKGFEAIVHKKIDKIRKVAMLYMIQKDLQKEIRFDVISIDNNVVTHFEGAF